MLLLSPFYQCRYWGTECLHSNPSKVTQLGCKVMIQIWPVWLQSTRSWLLNTLPLNFDVNFEFIITDFRVVSILWNKRVPQIIHICKESQMESIAQGKCLSLSAFVEASTMIWNDAVIWCQVGCSQSVTGRFILRWPIVLQLKRWF